jgi:hypothetical protein
MRFLIKHHAVVKTQHARRIFLVPSGTEEIALSGAQVTDKKNIDHVATSMWLWKDSCELRYQSAASVQPKPEIPSKAGEDFLTVRTPNVEC